MPSVCELKGWHVYLFFPQAEIDALRRIMRFIDELRAEVPIGALNLIDLNAVRGNAKRIIALHYAQNILRVVMYSIVLIMVIRLFETNADMWDGNKLLLIQLGAFLAGVGLHKYQMKNYKNICDGLSNISKSLKDYEAKTKGPKAALSR